MAGDIMASATKRPSRLFRNLSAKIASVPMVLTALVIFVGGTAWTVFYSFTNSKLLPRLTFVGLDQYERLWATPRWLVSIENLAIYGVLSLIFSLVIGFVLAALLDQKILAVLPTLDVLCDALRLTVLQLFQLHLRCSFFLPKTPTFYLSI